MSDTNVCGTIYTKDGSRPVTEADWKEGRVAQKRKEWAHERAAFWAENYRMFRTLV